MEWNGMEWNGTERNGMEWNGTEWNGMEWNGMEWNGMEWNGTNSTPLTDSVAVGVREYHLINNNNNLDCRIFLFGGEYARTPSNDLWRLSAPTYTPTQTDTQTETATHTSTQTSTHTQTATRTRTPTNTKTQTPPETQTETITTERRIASYSPVSDTLSNGNKYVWQVTVAVAVVLAVVFICIIVISVSVCVQRNKRNAKLTEIQSIELYQMATTKTHVEKANEAEESIASNITELSPTSISNTTTAVSHLFHHKYGVGVLCPPPPRPKKTNKTKSQE